MVRSGISEDLVILVMCWPCMFVFVLLSQIELVEEEEEVGGPGCYPVMMAWHPSVWGPGPITLCYAVERSCTAVLWTMLGWRLVWKGIIGLCEPILPDLLHHPVHRHSPVSHCGG